MAVKTRLSVWVVDVQNCAILVECPNGIHLDPMPACLHIARSSAVDELLNHSPWYIYWATLLQNNPTTLLQDLLQKNTTPSPNLPTAVIDKCLFDKLQQQDVIISNSSKKKPRTDIWFDPQDINGSPVYAYWPYRTLIAHVANDTSHHLSYALQLLHWRLKLKYCSQCGAKLSLTSICNSIICSSCNAQHYPNIAPCIIVAITRNCVLTGKIELLLAQHHRHKDGMYGLISGFVEAGESLEAAVARETFEETCLTIGNIRYSQSQPWPYPSNLMIGFRACYIKGDVIADKFELTTAAFFKLDNLPKIPNKGTIARTLIEQVKQGC